MSTKHQLYSSKKQKVLSLKRQVGYSRARILKGGYCNARGRLFCVLWVRISFHPSLRLTLFSSNASVISFVVYLGNYWIVI